MDTKEGGVAVTSGTGFNKELFFDGCYPGTLDESDVKKGHGKQNESW